jgi:hypothetical protein
MVIEPIKLATMATTTTTYQYSLKVKTINKLIGWYINSICIEGEPLHFIIGKSLINGKTCRTPYLLYTDIVKHRVIDVNCQAYILDWSDDLASARWVTLMGLVGAPNYVVDYAVLPHYENTMPDINDVDNSSSTSLHDLTPDILYLIMKKLDTTSVRNISCCNAWYCELVREAFGRRKGIIDKQVLMGRYWTYGPLISLVRGIDARERAVISLLTKSKFLISAPVFNFPNYIFTLIMLIHDHIHDNRLLAECLIQIIRVIAEGRGLNQPDSVVPLLMKRKPTDKYYPGNAKYISSGDSSITNNSSNQSPILKVIGEKGFSRIVDSESRKKAPIDFPPTYDLYVQRQLRLVLTYYVYNILQRKQMSGYTMYRFILTLLDHREYNHIADEKLFKLLLSNYTFIRVVFHGKNIHYLLLSAIKHKQDRFLIDINTVLSKNTPGLTYHYNKLDILPVINGLLGCNAPDLLHWCLKYAFMLPSGCYSIMRMKFIRYFLLHGELADINSMPIYKVSDDKRQLAMYKRVSHTVDGSHDNLSKKERYYALQIIRDNKLIKFWNTTLTLPIKT